jgi:hypothetical protein
VLISPRRNSSKSFSRSLFFVDPWITGASSSSPSISSWSRYAPITSVGSPLCLATIDLITGVLVAAVDASL